MFHAILYFSFYHFRSGHVVFLPRVVFFLPPMHPPCFCISSRQGRWQRGLFLLIFPDLYFVSSDVEINFSLGQKQTLLLAGTITIKIGIGQIFLGQRILLVQYWRDLDFYEQKFQETEKFHVRKLKCLVRATDRKMSVWRMETSDKRVNAFSLWSLFFICFCLCCCCCFLVTWKLEQPMSG